MRDSYFALQGTQASRSRCLDICLPMCCPASPGTSCHREVYRCRQLCAQVQYLLQASFVLSANCILAHQGPTPADQSGTPGNLWGITSTQLRLGNGWIISVHACAWYPLCTSIQHGLVSNTVLMLAFGPELAVLMPCKVLYDQQGNTYGVLLEPCDMCTALTAAHCRGMYSA